MVQKSNGLRFMGGVIVIIEIKREHLVLKIFNWELWDWCVHQICIGMLVAS